VVKDAYGKTASETRHIFTAGLFTADCDCDLFI